MAKLSIAQLMNLWKAAGGNPTKAPMAAAIAMAESSGDPNSKNLNKDGSTDRGLWQINSIHGPQSTFDPMANARAAVSISQNGNTWRPWCSAWSANDCSGSYLGNGAHYQNFIGQALQQAGLSGGEAGAGADTGTTPPSQDGGGGTPVTPVDNPLDPKTWAKAFLGPIAVWGFYGAMGAVGLAFIMVGVAILVWDSNGAKKLGSLAVSLGTRGAVNLNAGSKQTRQNSERQAREQGRAAEATERKAQQSRASAERKAQQARDREARTPYRGRRRKEDAPSGRHGRRDDE